MYFEHMKPDQYHVATGPFTPNSVVGTNDAHTPDGSSKPCPLNVHLLAVEQGVWNATTSQLLQLLMGSCPDIRFPRTGATCLAQASAPCQFSSAIATRGDNGEVVLCGHEQADDINVQEGPLATISIEPNMRAVVLESESEEPDSRAGEG